MRKGSMSNYIRSPKRAVEIDNQLSKYRAQDTFGMETRLNAIKEVFSARGMKFASAVDLGGACGFTSLELLDAGFLNYSVIYDMNSEFLSAGKKFASTLDFREKIIFKKERLDLQFVKEGLEYGDLCLCLNLMHHGGNFFDKEFVDFYGWERFAKEWLEALGEKFSYLVISIGFKDKLPKKWITPTRLIKYDDRPLKFLQIANFVGLNLIYEANVGDIAKFGFDQAQGRRLVPKRKGDLFRFFNGVNNQGFRIKLKFQKIMLRKTRPIRDYQYHLYIFDSGK